MKTLRSHSTCINSLMIVLMLIWQIGQPLQGATYTWNQTAAGTTYSWLTGANWTAGFPNAIGDVANLNNNIVGNQTISLNQAITLGTLNIGDSDGTHSFTLQSGSSAAGVAGYLIMDVASGNSAITKAAGANANDSILTGIQFNDTLDITNNSSGTLTFDGALRSLASNLNFAGSGAILARGVISTAGNLATTGTGTTTLSAANTYAGTTTIGSGTTLKMGIASALAQRSALTVTGTFDANGFAQTIGSLTGAGTILNTGAAAILSVGRDDTNSSFTGTITPATAANIAITKIGKGVLTLAPSAASTYTGNTIINGGGIVLDFANAGANTSLLAATPLQIAGGDFTMKGLAGLAANQTVGALTVGLTGGAITMIAGDALGTILRTGGVTATASGALLITAPTNTSVFLGTSYAAATLNNRLVFSDGTANTYNWVQNTGANTVTTAFVPSTALAIAGGGANTDANILTGSQTQNTASTTIRSLKLSSTAGSAQTLDLGTGALNMTLGGGTTTTPGAILIDGTAAWNINSSGTGTLTAGAADLIFQQYNTTAGVTVNAGISGTSTVLVKAGPGLLTLAGTNTFTGAVIVAGGTLSFSNVTGGGAGSLGGATGLTAVTLRDGATLQYTGGNGTISGTTATGGAHSFALQGGNANIEVTTGATALVLNGIITGAGGFTKLGAGTLTLSPVNGTTVLNSYTGPTIVSAGTLKGGAVTGAFGTNSPVTILNSAILDLGVLDQTIGSLTSASATAAVNNITTAKTLTVGGDNTSTTYAGTFTGAIANVLTKVGSGVFTVSSGTPSAWTGVTNVNGGVLKLGAANTLSTATAMTIGNAAVVAQFDMNGLSQTLAGVTFYGTASTLASSASVNIGSTGTLTLGGNVTYTSIGNPQPATINATGSGLISLNGTRTFAVGDSFSVPSGQAELTIAAPITAGATFGLTKTGTGTLALNGTTTFTASAGAVSPQGGTLLLDVSAGGSFVGTPTLALGATGIMSNFSVKGASSGSTSVTMGATSLVAQTYSSIVIDPNNGTGTALNLGAAWTRGLGGNLFIDLSSANTGTRAVNTGSAITGASAAAVNGVLGYIVVKDATGVGFGTQDGSFNIVRGTGTTTALTTSNMISTTTSTNFTTTPTDAAYSSGVLTIGNVAHSANTLSIASGTGGTLDLGGSTGVLTITAATGGILMTGAGDYTIQNGSVGASGVQTTIHQYGTGKLTISSLFSAGAGILNKDGDGVLVLSNANSAYTGLANVWAGTLRLGSAGSGANGPLGTTAAGTVVASGASLDLGGFTLATAEGLTLTGAGVGGVGALTNSTGTATYSGAITIAVGGQASIGGAGDIALTGTLDNTNKTAMVNKVGAGQLTLSTATARTGPLSIDAGTVNLTASAAAGAAGTVITLNSGTLKLINDTGATFVANPLVLAADSTIVNTTATATTGVTQTLGATTLGTNTLNVNSGSVPTTGTQTLVLGAVTLNGSPTLNIINSTGGATTLLQVGAVTGNAAVPMNTTIKGNGNFTATGIWGPAGPASITLDSTYTGIATLSGANTFTGGVAINGGTLKVNNAVALGGSAGAVSVATGAVLDLNGITMTNTNALTLNGTGISSGGALTNSSATAGTYAGLITLGSSGVSIVSNSGNILVTNAGTITGSGNALTLDGTATGSSITSIIGTGAGSLTKQGTGTWTLGGANTLTGGIALNGGTLIGTVAGALGTSANTTTFGGGALTLQAAGTTFTGKLNAASADGTVLVNPATAGAGVTHIIGATTLGGGRQLTVQGGALVTSGTAQLTTGAVTVSGGAATLNILNPVAASTTTVLSMPAIALAGNNLTITGSGNFTGSAVISSASGTPTVTLNSSFTGIATFTGANTWTGGLVVKRGTALANVSNATTVSGAFGPSANAVTLGDSTGSNNASLLANSITVSNAINVISGSTSNTLTIGNNGGATAAIFSGAITLANNLTVTNTGTTGTTTVGTGNITGSGNLTLNAINSTAGTGITLSGSVNPVGTITNSGASGAGATLISGVIGTNVTGVVQDSTVSSLTLGAVANLWSNGLTIKAGTVNGGNDTNTFGANGNVITLGHTTGSANATLNASNTKTYAQAITVAAGSSGNTLTISDDGNSTGAPTFGGAVTVNNDLSIAKTANSTGNFTFTGGFTTTSGTGNDITIKNNGSPASGGLIVISGSPVNNVGALTNNGTGSALAGVTISADIGTSVTNLTQSSTNSALTLSGTNIGYTGATAVSAGTLNITGSTGALLSTTSISVAGGATLNLKNTVGQAQNLGSGALSLGVGSGTTTLGLDLGSSSGPNYDRITTSATATTANTITINVTGLTGFNAGNYDLLNAGGGLSNAGATTYVFNGLGVGTTAGFAFSKTVSETLVRLTAAALGTDVYWTGAQADGKWNTVTSGLLSNWSTDSAGTLDAGGMPGIGQTVNFVSTAAVAGNPTTLATTLQQSFSINALNFNNTVGSGTLATVSIAPAAAETLTLNSSGTAILVDSGAPATINISAPIILAASQTWDIQNSGTTLTASGGVSGSAFGLTKAGPGKIILSGSGVTYTGTTSINAGTLTLSGTTAFASAVTFGASSTGTLQLASATQSLPSLATVDTTNNNVFVQPDAVSTTLTVNQATDTVFGGVLQDNGAATLALTKSGAGSLTLNNASTYTNGTTLSAGTLVLGNATALGTAGLIINAAAVTIASNAAITTTNTVAANFDFIVGGSTALGLGATTLSANRIITLNNTGLTTFASITGAAGRTLTLSGNGSSSIGAITTGAAATLTKNGTGTATLTATNTYTGATTINAGTLKMGSLGVLDSATAVTLANANNAATFDLDGTSQTVASLTIGGASGGVNTQGIVSIGSGGILTLGGTLTTTATGNTTLTHQINGGTIDLGGATRTFAVNDSTGAVNDMSISSNIQVTGGFGITKTQAGRLVLSGSSSSYTGTTTVTTGQLQFQGSIATSLPAASAISLGGGTLEFRNNDSGTLAYNNTVALTATSTIDVGNNGSGTNSVVQLGALSQTGATARQLNTTGANGYSVSLAGLGLATGTGATTTLNPTTASLSLTGNVTNGMSGFATTNFDTLALAGTATGNSIGGVISDAAGGSFGPTLAGGYTKITQSGGSTWRLSAVNTNTGAVAVQNGSLWLAGNNNVLNPVGAGVTLGNSTNSGKLIIGGNADGTTGDNLGSAKRTQQINQTYATQTGLTISGTGTANSVVGGADGGTSAGTPTNNSVLTLNIGSGLTDTYTGLIGWDGTGSVGFQNNINLQKSGGGTLVLSANLTNWTGTGSGGNLGADATRPELILSGGVLRLTSTATLNTVLRNTGGIIDDQGFTQGANYFLITTGGLITLNSANDTFAGAGITVTSTGVVALNFNNTTLADFNSSAMYLGAVGARNYTGSTLAAGDSSTYRFGGGAPWNAVSSSIVGGSGGNLRVTTANVITGANSVILGDNGSYNGGTGLFGGNSTVEFTTAQNYTGTTTLAGGSFVFSVAGALGTPTTAAGSIILDGGILRYSGITTDISNRLTIDSGGTIDTNTQNVTFATGFGNTDTGTSDATSHPSTNAVGGLTKIGAGTLTLSTTNKTYAGTTTVSGGTLQLNAFTSSLATTSGLTFGGGGTFRFDNTGTGTTQNQTMDALAFTAGDGVILSQRTAAQSTNLTFGSLTTRTAGATGNFTVGGTGSSASVNKVIFTAAPTPTNQFLNAGLYFGGTDFAVYDATGAGFVRAINYSTDTNVATSAGGATLGAVSGKDVQLGTAAVTAQTTLAVNSLKIAGAFGITIGSGQTLTVTSGGLIKTGATATITGGTLATSGELVIRQDASTDALLITSAINAGSLTKSGAGTLTINTTAGAYTGLIRVNGGTLSVDASDRLTGSTGLVLDGGTFLFSADANYNTGSQALLTLGLNGGSIRMNSGTADRAFGTAGDVVGFVGLGARTLTLDGVDNRRKVYDFSLGDNGGPTSVVIGGTGDNTVVSLRGANSYTGTTTITRGILRLESAGALPGGIGGASLTTNNTGGGNLIFAATGALPTNNRAVLELNATSGDFYRAVGTGFDQVSWTGHGGFSVSDATTRIVNLGGAGATLTWATNGFVPTGSALQFGQSASNVGFAGTIDFQNAVDLTGAARTVDVANGSQIVDAIMSGNITGTTGSGGLNKQGLGVLRLNGTNNTGALTVNVTGGTLYFEDSSAVVGASGTITVTATATIPAAIGVGGSTNPLTFFNSRLASASNGGFALDVSSSANFDFSTGNVTNMRLTAFNPANTAVYYTGAITPNGTTYRFGGVAPAVAANALVTTLILSNKDTLSGARSVDLAPGNLALLQSQNYTGGTGILTVLAGGSSNVGVGSDASFGSGTITLGNAANTIAFGTLNGDHVIANQILNNQTGTNTFVVGADQTSDGNSNNAGQGALTYLGTVNLGSRAASAVFHSRTNHAALFLGDISNSSNGLTFNSTTSGLFSILSTATNGGLTKSYTGAVILADNSNLYIDSNASLGSTSSALTLNGSTLALQPGTGTVTLTGRAITINTNDDPRFVAYSGGNLVLTTGITNGTPTAARTLSKVGAGTLTLQGKNGTWASSSTVANTNTLQIQGGKVVLESTATFTAASDRFLSDTNALPLLFGATNGTLGGGGTLEMIQYSGNANALTQAFTGTLTINQGAHTIQLTNNNTTQAETLNLGATFTRSAGGTMNFGSTTAGGTNTIGSTNVGANGIIGGWATFNGVDWATGSGTAISALTGLGYTTLGAASNSATTNFILSTGTVALSTSAAALNSLKLVGSAGGTNVTLNGTNPLTSGGILFDNTLGNAAISGGTQIGASGADLIVHTAGSGSGKLTLTAVVKGTNTALTKSGSGTLVLAGANTYTGSLFINAGTVEYSNAAASNNLGNPTASATNIILNGGTLSYTGSTSNTLLYGITVNSQSTLNVADAAGTLLFNPTGFGITGVAGTATTGVSGTTGILQKTGAGTLTILGGSTNTNLGLQVTAGTVNLAKTGTFLAVGETTNASGIPYAALIVNTGAAAKITGAGTDQIGNASSVVVQGTGFLDVNGSGSTSTAESFDGLAGNGIVKNTGASAFTLTLGSNNSSGISSYTVGAAQAATLAGDNNINIRGLNHFAGVIQDNIALTKIGSGTQILSGANTYTGLTTISAGTLKLGAANALPSGSGKGNVLIVGDSTATGVAVGGAANLLAPGTLDMGGFDQAINGLNSTTGGFVTNNPTGANSTNTLTVGSGNATGAFNGVIMDGYSVGANSTTAAPLAYVGTINLTKVGTATQTLSGANAYTGTTSINAGTLSVSVITGTNNNLGNATSAVVLGDATNEGTLSYTGSTTSFTRGFTVNAGGGQIDTTTSGQLLTISTANITSAANGTLTIGGAGNTTVTSAIQTGTGGLTKQDAGVLTLTSNSNNYTGNTAVQGGTLQLGSGGTTGSIDTGSAISVSTGATFAINRSNSVTQGTDFSGAAITGAGGLTQAGSGSTILNSANTYTGATTVSAGSLRVGDGTSGSINGTGTGTAGAVTVVKTGAVIGTNAPILSGGSGGNTGVGVIGGSTIIGDVSVNTSRGVIAPGITTTTNTSNQTLTFTAANTALTVAGGSQMELSITTPTSVANADVLLALSLGTWDAATFLAANPSLATGVPASVGNYDFINLTGTTSVLSLGARNGGFGNGTVSVVSNGYTAAKGDVFNLIDWTNNSSTAGSFSATTSGSFTAGGAWDDIDLPTLTGELFWDTSAFTSNGVLVVVPEPSRALFLMLGLLGFMLRRRRSV